MARARRLIMGGEGKTCWCFACCRLDGLRNIPRARLLRIQAFANTFGPHSQNATIVRPAAIAAIGSPVTK
jgi:hypothetical protein